MFLRPSAAKQTTVTEGTGTLALIPNAGDTRSLQLALGTGPVKGRFMLRGNGYYEQFRGTFTAPGTLARDEVIISSNSNNLVSIPPGTTDVYILDYANFVLDKFSTDKTLANADGTNTLVFTGAVAKTLTFPASANLLPDFWVLVRNDGTAILTLAPNGADTIADTTLLPGEAAYLYYDTTWKLLHIGRPAMVKLATLTASSSASLVFTGVSNAYKDYIFVMRDIRPATDNVDLYCQLSSDGGANWIAGDYTTLGDFANTSTGSAGGFWSSTTSIFYPIKASGATLSNDATFGKASGILRINDMGLVADQSMFSSYEYKRQGLDYIYAGNNGGGYKATLKSAKNAVRFTLSSGNIASGTIEVYGVK
ncbi:MAG: hypothetical protein EOP38_27890 [Rubrivivax sp.]|nr:MAG: hypothetical protein EOP38_27890 [Rubrivivax sp.]